MDYRPDPMKQENQRFETEEEQARKKEMRLT